MTDQYNMDQYNKETSQIHAPADLIRRTKEAVREEEQRLARVKQQQDAVSQPGISYTKVYKWALPVAAAIFCVVLLNVGLLRFRKDMSASESPQAFTADSASDTTAAGAASGGAESNEMGFQFEIEETYEQAEEAADEENERTDSDAGGAMNADTAVSAEKDVSEDNLSKEIAEAEKSYSDSIYGSNLWIEKIDEVPSFYGDSDTETIDMHGIKIYVAKDIDDTWIAYTQIGEERYVIRGELTEEDISREEFVEETYKLLDEYATFFFPDGYS